MNRYNLALLLSLLVAVWSERDTRAQGATEELTPESIQEAIRLGSDEKASGKFLQPYTVQTRTGMGTGPLIGMWSTPFARVVLAASAARKEGRTFAASDLTPDLLVRELQILVLPQQAAYADHAATIKTLVVVRRGGGQETIIRPITIAPASKSQMALHGLPEQAAATLASFPLTAVSEASVLRVSFSDVVRGSSAMTHCKDCVVPLSVNAIR